MRWIARLLVLLLILGGVAAAGLGFAVWRFEQPGPLAAETVVDIPRGAGVNQVAAQLEEAGIVEHRLLFLAGVLWNGGQGSLRFGEYAFGPAISGREAMALIQSGQVVQHPFTAPEGLTSRQIVALLNEDERLSGEIVAVPPEGALLPETYFFPRGAARQSVLDQMASAMDRTLEALWEERADGLPLETPEEALILASIVEKEAGLASEQPVVASVFINRLNRGMRLEADATAVYGLTLGEGPLGRMPTGDDVRTDTPYNTYRIPALPPGPIANPGRAALAATLNPAETDYLFFVADGSGGHAFARTLDEHNRNVAEWRRFRREQAAN